MYNELVNKLHRVKQAYVRNRRLYPELARELKRAGKAIEKQIVIARAQEVNKGVNHVK
jgi:hypothetical protein